MISRDECPECKQHRKAEADLKTEQRRNQSLELLMNDTILDLDRLRRSLHVMKEEIDISNYMHDPYKESSSEKESGMSTPDFSDYIVLLLDDNLSGSLDPEKSNHDELEVIGTFDSMDEALDWIEISGNGSRWLCQVHKINTPKYPAKEETL